MGSFAHARCAGEFTRALTLVDFAVAVTLGGANFLGVRFSNRELAPFWGAGLRFGLAAPMFVVIAPVLRLHWPCGHQLGLTAACCYWFATETGRTRAEPPVWSGGRRPLTRASAVQAVSGEGSDHMVAEADKGALSRTNATVGELLGRRFDQARGVLARAVVEQHRERALERASLCGMALPADGLLFSRSIDASQPWFPDSVSRSFQRLAQKAGLKGARLLGGRYGARVKGSRARRALTDSSLAWPPRPCPRCSSLAGGGLRTVQSRR